LTQATIKRFPFQLATNGTSPLYVSQTGNDVEVFTNGVVNFFPSSYKADILIHVASITNPTGFVVNEEKYTDQSKWVEKYEGAAIYSLVIGQQLKALTNEIAKYFPYEKVGFKLYKFDPHVGLGSVIVADFDADLIVPFTTIVYNEAIYAVSGIFQDGTNEKRAVSLALPNFDKSKVLFQHYVLVAYTENTSGEMKEASRYVLYPKDSNGNIRSDIKLAVRECKKPLASFVAYTLDPPISLEDANKVGIDFILMSRLLKDNDPEALTDFTLRVLTSGNAIGGFMHVNFVKPVVESITWTQGKEGEEGAITLGNKQTKVSRLFCIPL